MPRFVEREEPSDELVAHVVVVPASLEIRPAISAEDSAIERLAGRSKMREVGVVAPAREASIERCEAFARPPHRSSPHVVVSAADRRELLRRAESAREREGLEAVGGCVSETIAER